jgi:hypothetical protein
LPHEWQERLAAAGSKAGKGVDKADRKLFQYSCGCYGYKQIRSMRRRPSALACPEHDRGRKPSQLLQQVRAAVLSAVPDPDPIVLEACLLPKGSKAFDMWLPKYNIGMEVDGRQHFDGEMHSKAAAAQYQRDRLIDALCEKARVRLLRFHYADDKQWGSLAQWAVRAVQGNPHCWFIKGTHSYQFEAGKRAAAVAGPTL